MDRQQYEDEKKIAVSGDSGKRLTLAKNTKTHQEILYYLAEKDPDPRVRKAVAENSSMPVQVSTVLVKDRDEDVRLALAARLVDLLPDLSQDRHSQLYAFAVQALGDLALDEVLRIRVALSSTLKDLAQTPPSVAGQLARDIERQVSEPILRFCAALSDHDLLDILKSHPEGWALQAIASRDSVSEDVSKAVIEKEDESSGALLIENEGAKITHSLLEKIIEMAKKFPEWQKPTATRKMLPPSMARKLAEFVDESVRNLLEKREDFDAQTTQEITEVFRRRLDFAENAPKTDETGKEKLKRLLKDKTLDEEAISDALGMREKEFVIEALAHLLDAEAKEIKKVLYMKAPKALISIVWKAGLSMRLAFQIQRDFAHIPPKDLIYPRGGTDYPLSEEDMNWQLEFLNLK